MVRRGSSNPVIVGQVSERHSSSGSQPINSSFASDNFSVSTDERSDASSSYGSPRPLRYVGPSTNVPNGFHINSDHELTRNLDSPGMLRTVTARTVLRGFGRVFRSQGIDSAYALSQECERLGYFISHSWSAPWLSKYITLAFHFNFWIATVVSFISIGLFLVFGLIYLDHDAWNEIRDSINPSLIFVAIGLLSFVPALLFGSEVIACFPFVNSNRTRCFLDKCCINQTDPILKRQGIEALGVFLARSDVLLILWSPDYFLRLWCAYEVGAYMSLTPEDGRARKVVMIPLELVSFASLVFGLDLVIQIVSVNFFFQGSDGLPEWATHVTATVIAALFAAFAYFFSYRWQIDQAYLREQLAEFSLSKTECSDPSDRPLVLRDIAQRYSVMEKTIPPSRTISRSRSAPVPEPISEEFETATTREPSPYPSRQVSSIGTLPSHSAAGLRAFEEYVRTNLQEPIEKALGTHHCVLPYRFLLTMSLPSVWVALGLICHWILKAQNMGDTQDTMDTESIVFLIFSKLLRSITFYPLLTAALLLYQDTTELWAEKSHARQVFRGTTAVVLIGVYVYMFGFHYIFLRQMKADIVFYTTLPQVLLFLLIYTRLGVFMYKGLTDVKHRLSQTSFRRSRACSKPKTDDSLDREATRSSTQAIDETLDMEAAAQHHFSTRHHQHTDPNSLQLQPIPHIR